MLEGSLRKFERLWKPRGALYDFLPRHLLKAHESKEQWISKCRLSNTYKQKWNNLKPYYFYTYPYQYSCRIISSSSPSYFLGYSCAAHGWHTTIHVGHGGHPEDVFDPNLENCCTPRHWKMSKWCSGHLRPLPHSRRVEGNFQKLDWPWRPKGAPYEFVKSSRKWRAMDFKM